MIGKKERKKKEKKEKKENNNIIQTDLSEFVAVKSNICSIFYPVHIDSK